MTAFLNTPLGDGHPNRETLDNDFYKPVMGQFIHRFYRGVKVRFSLINRDKGIPLAEVVPEHELRAALDAKRTVHFRRRDQDTNIAYMRGMRMHGQNMFSEEYFEFLENDRLPEYTLTRNGSQYALSTKEEEWASATNWEIPFMQIPVELYYRELLRRMTPMEREVLYSRARDLLYRELTKLANSPYKPKIVIFGTRRRNSFLWEKFVTAMCKEVLGDQLVGTSNIWMANHFNMMPMGTNAHELPMVVTALAGSDKMKRRAQYQVLRQWEDLYGLFLRICLPDTFGTEQFLANAPEWVVNWRGFRDDSGNTFENIERYIDWYQERGIADPKAAGKLVIPSDGLNADMVLKIANWFDPHINLSYGMGTQLTNLFFGCHPTPDRKVPGLDLTWAEAFRPFSIVCKADSVNGKPVVKLSNNITKATGPKDEVDRYVGIFGSAGRIVQEVVV
jgi:nicotinate phosphoribosyltransferase